MIADIGKEKHISMETTLNCGIFAVIELIQYENSAEESERNRSYGGKAT